MPGAGTQLATRAARRRKSCMRRVTLALVLSAGAVITPGTRARAPTRPPGRTGGHRGARQTAPLPSGDRPGPGVFAIRGVLLHRYAFKAPMVRNVAVTAPYMHNGVFRTLDEVVEFYDRGGGAGLGIELPNWTLSPEPSGSPSRRSTTWSRSCGP